MKQLTARIKPNFKPKHGYAHVIHFVLLMLLPIVLFLPVHYGKVFGYGGFVFISVGLLFISKWRMFAVRKRYWIANIRGNAADIFVGLSIIFFMQYAKVTAIEILWVGLYAVWLLIIKSRSSIFWVSAQALIAQTVGLSAVYTVFPGAPIWVLILLHAVVCYYSARHFFTSFEEPHSRHLSLVWAYFASSLAWLTGHWQIYYSVVSQPALILVVLSFGLGGLYYLDHHDRLTTVIRRQILFVMSATVSIVLIEMVLSVGTIRNRF